MARSSISFLQGLDFDLRNFSIRNHDNRWQGVEMNPDGIITSQSVAYGNGDVVEHNGALWLSTNEIDPVTNRFIPNDNNEPRDSSSLWLRVSDNSSTVVNRFDSSSNIIASYLRNGPNLAHQVAEANGVRSVEGITRIVLRRRTRGVTDTEVDNLTIFTDGSTEIVTALNLLSDINPETVGLLTFEGTNVEGTGGTLRVLHVYFDGTNTSSDPAAFTFNVIAVTNAAGVAATVPFITNSVQHTFSAAAPTAGNTSQFTNNSEVAFQSLVQFNLPTPISQLGITDILASYQSIFGDPGNTLAAYDFSATLPQSPILGATAALDITTGAMSVTVSNEARNPVTGALLASNTALPQIDQHVEFVLNTSRGIESVFGQVVRPVEVSQDAITITARFNGRDQALLAYGSVLGIGGATDFRSQQGNTIYYGPGFLSSADRRGIIIHDITNVPVIVTANNGELGLLPNISLPSQLVSFQDNVGSQVDYTGLPFGTDWTGLNIHINEVSGPSPIDLFGAAIRGPVAEVRDIDNTEYNNLVITIASSQSTIFSASNRDLHGLIQIGDMIRLLDNDGNPLSRTESEVLAIIPDNLGLGQVVLSPTTAVDFPASTFGSVIQRARHVTRPGIIRWNGVNWV